MRLDAREGDGGWYVFHVPTSQPIPDVLWIDDESRQYFVVDGYLMASRTYVGRIETAREISIRTEGKIILVDPVQFEPHAGELADMRVPILNGEY